MKTTFLLLLLPTLSFAQTNVSGFISVNTTWNLAGSPYIVTGNVLVSSGFTLIIEPGVTVNFNTDKALQIDGELIAIGTPLSHITFTSNQSNPTAGDWAKIHFPDTCTDAVFDVNGNYLLGSIMKYCDVLYGGGLGFGEIDIEGSSPYISHCNIKNSSSAGIYCHGTTFLIDSSAIKNCLGYGLYFDQYYLKSYSLLIQDDTFENNCGAIFLDANYDTFPKKIIRNYFISNYTNGALWSPSVKNLIISENYFINNTAQTNKGIITFQYASNFIIACNKFINNNSGKGAISGSAYSSLISSNVFDGNSSSGISVCNLDVGSPSPVYFTNNIVKNNSSTSGSICVFTPRYVDNGPFLQITFNEFGNNSALNTIKITTLWGVTNASYNCLYLKHNNLLDNTIAIYNDVPYGSPNIYVDSNYWGGSSTQHIDSVIYDYFDFANKSVVYYSPILSLPVLIDTTCVALVFPTGINELEEQKEAMDVKLFPNPFSSIFTIKLSSTRQTAISLYDCLGRQILRQTFTNTTTINTEQLSDGIYFYELHNDKELIKTGKVVKQ